MNKTLRAATIGCGRMGAFHSKAVETTTPNYWMPISHLDAIAKIEGITAVACCDVSDEHRLGAQEKYGIANSYSSYLELLETENIDLITIATRTPFKTQIIEAALNHGVRAIHVEKPLCNSVAELKLIEQKIEQAGAFLTYGCLRRYLPSYNELKNLVETEEFGTVQDIHVEMGKASLLWTHVHSLDQLLFFANNAKPIKIQAWFEHFDISEENDQHILNDPQILSATVYFESGVVGRIGCSGGVATSISSATSRVDIFADGNQVFISKPDKNGAYMHKEEVQYGPYDGLGGSGLPIQMLCQALAGDKNAIEIVEQTKQAVFRSQHLIFGLLESHLNGGRIVDYGVYNDELKIEGISYGNPA